MKDLEEILNKKKLPIKAKHNHISVNIIKFHEFKTSNYALVSKESNERIFKVDIFKLSDIKFKLD